jgi:hypothetical protein
VSAAEKAVIEHPTLNFQLRSARNGNSDHKEKTETFEVRKTASKPRVVTKM